jgi:hypothetical protein
MSATITRTASNSSVGWLREPLRDIARGGLAGLLTGILIAGVGGRIVMRAAALLVPDAAGRLTENGNRIGEITLSGTVGLVLAGALFVGLPGAVLWVVMSPWIPGGRWTRALLAMPVAVSLTGVLLIQAQNPDFAVLRHDATVVVLLLALVALAGFAMTGFDGWLDGRLPAAASSGPADALYLALSIAGGALILPIVLAEYLGAERLLGLALVAVGVATLVRWAFRSRRLSPPFWLVVLGRGSLLVAVGLGVLALAPDLASALGAS